MEPSASKSKRSVRKYLRKSVDKIFGSSPTQGSLSQQPSRAPSVQSTASLLVSVGQITATPHDNDAAPVAVTTPLLAQAEPALPVAPPVSATSPNEPPSVVEPPTISISSPVVESRPVIAPSPHAEIDSAVERPSTTEPPEATNIPTASEIQLAPVIPSNYQPVDTAPPGNQNVVTGEASNNRQEYEQIATELTSVAESLAQRLSPSTSARMSGTIARIARDIEEQSKLINSKRNTGIGSRLLEASTDVDEIAKCYRQVESLFRQLQIDASLSIWSIVDDHITDTRLAKLAPVKLANYDSKLSTGISRRTCTEGTRMAILSGLNDWSYDPKAADIYWMNGMAGTGKTTIACTFAEALEERNQLAASFFCTRTVPECRDVNRIIPTIAYQLAQYSIPYQSELCQALASDPNVAAKNVVKQFERLLKEPLLKVKEAIPNSLVVAIDALDECDDMVEVELLLSILLKYAADLPVKFFVTSRPEPEIYNRMLARGQGRRAVMHLHEVETSLVQADIELYLEMELEFVSPTAAQVKDLSRRSGTLFIYAATLVRYIRFRKAQADPQRRLRDVLSTTPETNRQYAEVDALYAAIIKVALDEDGLTSEEAECVRRVLQAVVCVQEPVSIEVVATLAGLNSEARVLAALQPLRAVLHFSETTGLVSTLHASFSDFLFDEARSGAFNCNLTIQSELMAQSCFNIMKSQLRFNICRLESSFVPDCDVDDIDARVERAISPALWYACRYWSRHLGFATSNSDELSALLKDFLLIRLFFWMEVLNLKRDIGMAMGMLLTARTWIQAGTSLGDILARLTEDAWNLVTILTANAVSISTPHIYISLLPFCPKPNSVSEEYWNRTNGLIKASGTAIQKGRASTLAKWDTRSPVLAVSYSPNDASIAVGHDDGTITVRNMHGRTSIAGPFKGHTEAIKSVAYSPDGARIASGSWDMTIRVWNAHDGALVSGPFTGHTDRIQSVSYSPHSTHIVSGSFDMTIRIWNTHNGTPVGIPLKGHTGPVNSAVYSPDGTRIASGSSDKTIRVWDIQNSTCVTSPFKGHTHSVNTVAYSPNGIHIVSGSSDKTVRVWDAYNGTSITSPLAIHTSMVQSVAFSPGSTRVVSGSSDKTICIWNASDGVLTSGPLKAHTDSVQSVVYSSEGSYILSGSYDNSIRVWDASHSERTADPLEHTGHADPVWSVAYSPDGARLVSGSYDTTIRVWNPSSGVLVMGPLEGHTDFVNSVAYSPDGTRIVSGSSDTTIRVWDANSGTTAAGPLRGHAKSVNSVAYSPDGTRIVSGSFDMTVRVWHAHDGSLIAGPFVGHISSVGSVAYSPNGTRIASGSDDMTIRVWDARDGTLVASPLEGHTFPVNSVAYSPDGARIVSGSSDNTIRVWNAHDGTLVAGPLEGHTDWVRSVAYSPGGTHIVSGSDDKTIRVWSAHDGTLVAGPLKGHTKPVKSVTYSPDGTRIVSGSDDKTIRVWDAQKHASSVVLSVSPPQPSNPISDDGWVVDSNHNLLFWVPPGLRFAFTTPPFDCVLIIDDQGRSLGLDYGDMLFGSGWDRCYMSE